MLPFEGMNLRSSRSDRAKFVRKTDNAPVAQTAQRLPRKQEITSSILVGRSKRMWSSDTTLPWYGSNESLILSFRSKRFLLTFCKVCGILFLV